MLPIVWLSAGFTVVVDQLSKQYVLKRSGAKLTPRLGSGIRVVGNARLGLGFIRERRGLFLLWALTVLGTILLTHNVAPLQEPLAQIGLGAALGGATGNVLDMWRRGAVIDFIDLRIWPVFNLADTAIVGGAAVALWSLMHTLAAD